MVNGRVSFPRGYLLDVGSWSQRLPWTNSYVIRKNAAYSLMLYDVLGWLLRRTDISGLAGDMVIKGCLSALGAVAEGLIVDATSPPLGRRQKMKSRIKRLSDDGVVLLPVANELSWLWDMRNRQHLQELGSREFDVYQRTDVSRAEAVVFDLCDALKARAGAA